MHFFLYFSFSFLLWQHLINLQTYGYCCCSDLVPLPGLTPENNKLLFYRLIDYDADKVRPIFSYFNSYTHIKDQFGK